MDKCTQKILEQIVDDEKISEAMNERINLLKRRKREIIKDINRSITDYIVIDRELKEYSEEYSQDIGEEPKSIFEF